MVCVYVYQCVFLIDLVVCVSGVCVLVKKLYRSTSAVCVCVDVSAHRRLLKMCIIGFV